MARMNHVMRIGKPQDTPAIYLEDYAYTYLKREAGSEKKKYFLYGEKEGNQNTEKIYIYGISASTKEENTYFKDFYPVGLLKIREGEKIFVNRKGQEKPIQGFYVFYAPNQAMQEYLVDTNAGGKEEDKLKAKPGRQFTGKRSPIKDKFVFPAKVKRKTKKRLDFGNLVFYGGCLFALLLFGIAVTGGNGYHKLAGFKEMVLQTMGSPVETVAEQDFIVEEQRMEEGVFIPEETTILDEAAVGDTSQEGTLQVDTVVQESDVIEEATPLPLEEEQIITSYSEESMDEIAEVITEESIEEDAISQSESEEQSETYVVQEGDTLAKICINQYGSTERMQEVCAYNNIENEDHIAPGQKLYLPN